MEEAEVTAVMVTVEEDREEEAVVAETPRSNLTMTPQEKVINTDKTGMNRYHCR